MTIQQLRYVLAVAESGSVTEAARRLFLSQPSLSNALREVEREAGVTIFLRDRTGVSLTQEGTEFLGYARQVLQQMQLLEDKYMAGLPPKIRFSVSAQHYTFTENAFVQLVKRFGQERYAFYFRETGTHQVLEDVRNRTSDLGVLYLSRENEPVIRKSLREGKLRFTPLFSARLHVFLQKGHPLARRPSLGFADLSPYPRLNFVQGNDESVYFSEEMFRSLASDKEIHINDRGAIVSFMLGLNAYTISSGIFPKSLHGRRIVAIPLETEEQMEIGYSIPSEPKGRKESCPVLRLPLVQRRAKRLPSDGVFPNVPFGNTPSEGQALGRLGKGYIQELRKYAPGQP